MLSDVGFLPIFLVSRRFACGRGRWGWRSRDGSRMRQLQSSGVDRPGDGAEETQALLEVPDPRARKGVPLQRLRVEAKAMGARAQSESHRAPSQDLVSKSSDEEQEEQSAAVAAAEQQQQQQQQR